MNATFSKCPCNNCSAKIEFETGHAGETVTCPHCQLETVLFVPYGAPTILAPPIIPPMIVQDADADIIFLKEGGIAVTRTRLILPGEMYAMAHITSVRLGRIPPETAGPILLLLGGAAFGLLIATVAVVSGILIAIVSIALGIVWMRRQKPIFQALVVATSGEKIACQSYDSYFVFRVIEAISKAMIARG